MQALPTGLATRAANEAELRSRLALACPGAARAAAGVARFAEVDARPELTETLSRCGWSSSSCGPGRGRRERRRAAESRAEQLERQVGDYAARSAGAYEAIEQLRARTRTSQPVASGLRRRRPATAPAGSAPAGSRLAEAPGGLSRSGEPPSAERRLRLTRRAWTLPSPACASPPRREEATPASADPTAPGTVAGGRVRLCSPSATRWRPGACSWRFCPPRAWSRPEPLAYDLVLDGLGCVQVTVAAAPAHLHRARRDSPARPSEVRFALTGDLGSLAALVASGSLRRRFGRRRVRLTGERSAAGALLAARAHADQPGWS